MGSHPGGPVMSPTPIRICVERVAMSEWGVASGDYLLPYPRVNYLRVGMHVVTKTVRRNWDRDLGTTLTVKRIVTLCDCFIFVVDVNPSIESMCSDADGPGFVLSPGAWVWCF